MEAAEGATALAVAELLEALHVPPDERVAVARTLRGAILGAVLTFAATYRPRRRYRIPKPSRN